jgi:hypothetical protein
MSSQVVENENVSFQTQASIYELRVVDKLTKCYAFESKNSESFMK